jgi:ferredoxin
MTGGFSASTDGQLPVAPAGGWVIGGNVPWSVSWTEEGSYDIRLSTDFPGLVDLVQVERPGVGAPRFAALHISRHRLGMAGHLCHVCGKATPPRDRYVFPKESGGFVVMPDDSSRYAGNVPPVHLACAKRAQQLCPHLRSAFAEPVAFPREESRLIERTSVMPGMEAVARDLPRNLKVVFTCYRLFGPRFTKQVQQLRGLG